MLAFGILHAGLVLAIPFAILLPVAVLGKNNRKWPSVWTPCTLMGDLEEVPGS